MNFSTTFASFFRNKRQQPIRHARKAKRTTACMQVEQLEDRIQPSTITQWTFENNTIAVNNSPTASTGTGTASGLGMTNSYNSTTSTNTDDVLAGVSGDTGTNGLADTTQVWRIRGQAPGNGWSSQAPIGTQGAEFAVSTVNYSGPINVSFDWYATTQGEGNLQLEYTTNGTTWNNVAVTVPVADTSVTALTNSTSSNTVLGSYVQMSGQQWAPNLTATITDPNAANDANFAIELVNASTGADCISAAGTPLNNSSGNWRFDNVTISGTPQGVTPTTAGVPTFTPATANFGASVSFTDVVTANNGSTAPTAGSVTFMSGTTVLATATSDTTSGTASTFTVSTTSIPVGTYSSITAVYNAGAGFGGSTSSASSTTLTINGTATTTAVPTFAPTTVTFGSSVNFTAVVTASTGSAAPTAGTVTFMNGSTVLATATSESTSGTAATFTVSSNSISVGAYSTITAVYAANGAFLGSTSSASATTLTVNPAQAPQGTVAQWTFENDSIAVNNSPAPSTGVGTASGLGMTNSYNSTTSTNTDDVVQGASGDTGANGLADLTHEWRIRGQTPGNGWSSQAPIGTQGAEFATSTVGFAGPINVSFDWYATTQGEGKLQFEYTTNGTTWINLPIIVPAADTGVAAHTNSSSANTVIGSYVQLSAQDWAPNLTVSITDPAATNDPNFAIELVNASTGADCVNTAGGALNNTSGNWRFDNITITGTTAQNFTPGNLVELQAGDGVNAYANQAPVFLDEVTPAGAAVQQVDIPDTAGSGAVGITSATETGTTVTITTTNTALFATGESITISGITPSAWDGTVPITELSSTQFTYTAAASLPAITSLTSALATPSNQPLTIDLTGATGNGQLNRSYDGTSLTLDGVDSTVNQGGTGSATGPTGTLDRDLAVITGDPNIPSDINTATYGPWNTADDNRGSVAESATGPIYQFGHQNDSGALYAGVHQYTTEGGPSTGNQVSAGTSSNIRGETIGFDNRLYYSSAAGVTAVSAFGSINGSGIFTNPTALPTSTTPTPSQDIMIVPNPITNGQLGPIFFADMNGDGIMDNGDRVYFDDNGTKGGAGTGGLYVATWNTSNNFSWDTPNNAPAAAAGILDYWGVPVRLGDAPVQSAAANNVGNMQGLTGTVLNSTTVELFTSAFDNAAGDSSIVQEWTDSNTGVSIANAQITTGATVEITTATANAFTTGQYVSVDGIVSGSLSHVAGGFNGTWQITVIDSTHFTYTDTNSGASSLAAAANQGGADVAITADLSQASTYQNFGIGINNSNNGNYNSLIETFGGTVVQTLAEGSDAPTNAGKAEVGLRSISFAPVAATTVMLTQGGGNLTATLTNTQVTPSGTVTFINENTGTVLGQGTISATAPYTATLASNTVIGNAYVEAYFAGGGTNALASAASNTIQVTNAGSTASSVGVVATPTAVAVGTPVTLTATVTSGTPAGTGNVSFYNTTGGAAVSLATLIGTATLSGATATLITSFGSAATQTITAVYNGDSTYASSQNTTTVAVALNATVAITPSTNNVALGATPSYTATITGNATLGTPAGSVVFNLVSADTTSTGAIAQTGSFTVGSLTPGPNNTATAVWSGVALTHPGSYLITMTYTPAVGSPYSSVAITATSSSGSGAAETNLALIETVQQAFTPGDLVAVQRGDGTVLLGSSGQLVFIDEYTPAGTLVQSIALPNSITGSNNPLLLGGQNGSQGLISRSANGYDLTLTGYDASVGQTFLTSTFPYQVARTIAEVNAGATINTTTAISAASPASVPYEVADVASYDGSEFWLDSSLPTGDTTDSGILYVGSVGATSATQIGAAGIDSAALTIAGGQLYSTQASGSNTVEAVGAGLPTTAGQTLTGLPNLAAAYALYFPTKRSPEEVLLLNTNDGTTNNPNVAYIADQNYGLLKFYLDTNSSDTTYGDWEYGSSGTETGGNAAGVFGQKLVSAGGVTGVSGYVVNPGPNAQVQLYVTGSNTQGTNANQIDSLLDTHAGAIGSGALAVDNGFPSTLFTPITVVGASGYNSGTANGNENFAGLAFVPAAQSTTVVTSSALTTTYGNNVTFTATVTSSQDTPAGTVSFYDGLTLLGTGTLNGSGVATFTTTTPLTLGTHPITALYNPGGHSLALDGTSNGTLTETIDYTPGDVVVATVGTDAVVGTVASITESGTTATLTTSAANGLVSGQTVTLSGVTPAGYNSIGTATYTVTVTSSTTFTFTATAGLGTAAAGGTVYLGVNANATATSLQDYTGGTQNSGNTVSLPSAAGTANVSGATWAAGPISTAKITTSAAHNFQVGQSVTITGATPAGYNGTFTVLSVPSATTFVVALATNPGSYTSGGAATVQAALTEVGTTTTAGYLGDSLDGHSLSLAGYNSSPNASTSSANRVIGVVSPSGSVNTATQLSSSAGAITAALSADGQGFYVDAGASIRYVSFGGTTPSAISAASWAATTGTVAGGIATITAPNSYLSGQSVIVAGIGTATGYNGTFTILTASATQFTYFLATQPTGTPTFTAATSQLLPLSLTNELTGSNAIAIGSSPNGVPNQLFVTAGIQFQNNGVPSIDGPAEVGTGLPESGGQTLTVLGTGTAQNWPSATDIFGNYPATNQIAISPDGQTIFVADSRVDGLGGILEYYQAVYGSWVLLGRLQVDNYTVTGASETGTTVTVTTSTATDYYVGESVTIDGLVNTAYDGTYTVTGVSGTGFTYTGSFTGLASTTPGVHGATVTSADGGFRALVANFNGSSPILYATTTATTGNRLLEITGGTTNGFAPSFAYTVLATAAPNTAFRGVALAPTAAGATASTNTLSVSPSSSDYATGVTLTATVTSGATGWVSFETNGVEIGAAQLNSSGIATLNTGGDLAPGTYNIIAVYTGDSTYASSTSSAQSTTITKTATSTTLTFSPAAVGTSQSDTLTAILTVPTGVAPTGTVTFTNTTSSITLGTSAVTQAILNVGGIPTIAFEATLVAPAGTFAAGTYNISATYSGDGYFNTSTGTNSLSVVNSTTTTVTSNLANPTANPSQALTLSAAVTSTAGGTPGGTVQFYDDTLALGSPVTLNGSGVATLAVNTALVQSVTVTLASENNLTGSLPTTTVTLTTDANNPMTVGESVTVEGINTQAYDGTFTVTAVSGNTFSYVDNNAEYETPDTAGGLAIGLNVLTPGLHSISAVYTPTGASLTSFANSTGVLEQKVQSQAFGAGDVFTERNGDGITPLNTRAPNPVSGSVGVSVYIDELTPSGTLIQTFALPTADSQGFSISAASESGTTVSITTASPNNFAVGQLVTIAGITPTGYTGTYAITGVSGNTFTYTATSGLGTATLSSALATGTVHAVVGDGQQSTTGQMTLSGDGQDLFLTGYDNNPLPYGTALAVPTGTGSASVPRSIAQISYNGTVQTEAFSTSMTLNSSTSAIFDGVYSPDGKQFYISGYNGVYYFPSVTQSASLQGSNAADQIVSSATTVIALESFGGNLYAIGGGSSTAASTRIQQVGVGLPIADEAIITGASWASSVATITANNNYVAGQSVAVAGITTATGYNGTFTILSANSTQFTYALATQPTGTPGFAAATASLQAIVTQLPGIPVNSAVEPTPIFFPVDAYLTHTNGAGTTLDTIYIADDGKSFGAGAITKWSLVNDNISSITESGTTATVTLAAATLGLVVGEAVNITITGETPSGYNGTVAATVVSPTSFTFTATSGLGTATTNGTASAFVENGVISYSDTVQQVGFYWLAGKTNTATDVVTLYSTYGNGGNADFGPGITYSVADADGYNVAPGIPITAASWASSAATITANNNFSAGQYVTISGITPSGYDGLFTITSANATSFTYALASNPGTATVTGANAMSLNTVNTVAFEGTGGGYAGNEVTRGVADAPQAQTTTLVDNGPNASTTLQAITLTVTVASPGSPNTPTGTITLEDASNGNAVVPTTGNTLSSTGVATLTVAAGALSAGTHNLFAVYSGDSYHQSQNSTSVSQVVNAISTTTTITSNTPNPSNSGQNVAFAVTVSPTVPNGEIVTLKDASNGNAVIGSGTLTSGTVTINVSSLSVGTHNIFAVYGGDSIYASSQSTTVSQVVNAVAPTVSSVVVNGGAPQYTDSNGLNVSLAGQNSVVDQILVTFSQAVTVGAGAFTVTNDASAVTVYGGPSPNTAAVTTNFTPVSGSGNTQFIVTFSGAGTTAIPGGSGNVIKDGLYVLNVVGANVTSNATGLHPANTNKVFWALYGSASSSNVLSPTLGDGNSEIFVDTSDFTLFHNTFGSESDIPAGPPAYNAAFDSNLDGYVDTLDFSKFHSNFGADWGF